MIGDTYFGKAWMPDFATRGAGKPGRTPPQRMAPLPDSNRLRKPSKPSQKMLRGVRRTAKL